MLQVCTHTRIHTRVYTSSRIAIKFDMAKTNWNTLVHIAEKPVLVR